MSAKQTCYPQRVNLSRPAGTRDRAEALAVKAGQSLPQWLRGAIRRAIGNGERTELRRRAG